MAIIEVIKYNGDPELLAWKYPSEELGTWTQLIVNESQEAVLYKGGKALDVFPSGRHTLETANIPFLNKIVNLPFGGRSPFAAEVWYVNRAYSLDVKWGTATPIQIQDPKYQIFCPIRANGMFGIRVEDSKKFLVKLVGTMSSFDRQSMVKYFRGLYITKIKDVISSYIIKKQISIVEINAYIDELSLHMKKCIEPVLYDYGIELANFYVNDISVPEDDSAVKKLKDALAKRAEMDIIGYNYQQERSFDTLEGAAKNSGSVSAPLMGAGLGLGMGVGLGGTVGSAFGGVAQTLDVSAEKKKKQCPNCHAQMDSPQRFCGDCGFDSKKNIEEMKEKESSVIKCSKCGSALKGTSKFCFECGNKYDPCPKCGADIDESSKACPKCGYEIPGTCPNCQAPMERNAKFCSECGFSLVKKCPKCEAPIEGDPKFCSECGESLR